MRENIVGVIQVGNLTLEILPKADRVNRYNNSEAELWRSALLSMLKICKKISADAVNESELQRRKHSLLDLYFNMYLKEIELLLHQGLFKKYKQHTGNIDAWIGRLDFSKNIQYNLVRKDRFYTAHQIYSYDHTINRILSKALEIIVLVSTDISTQSKCQNFKALFPEVCLHKVNAQSFKRIRQNRKLKPYAEALKIAEIIIVQFSPEIKSGGTRLLALLFDMNKLWEEYIYRMVLKTNLPNCSISSQEVKRFWNYKTVRPDIVLTLDNITYVIDTKWKVIDKRRPSDSDLKQMYVYNMYWSSAKSMLLYPQTHSDEAEETFGIFHQGRESDNLCKLGFINVLDENGNLDQEVGHRIIEKLQS